MGRLDMPARGSLNCSSGRVALVTRRRPTGPGLQPELRFRTLTGAKGVFAKKEQTEKQQYTTPAWAWLNTRTRHGDLRPFHRLVRQRTTAVRSDREGELSMKSLLLMLTAVALSFGFG